MTEYINKYRKEFFSTDLRRAGEPNMKNKHWKLTAGMILALLLALLLLPAAAEEGVISGDLDGFFGWVYPTSVLPENAVPRDHTIQISSMVPRNAADSSRLEGLTGCTVEFVRGDEFLREAVKVTFDRMNNVNYATLAENTVVTANITIDNAALTAPGTATFVFTFQSEHYTAKKTETLRVLSPEEVPSVTELFDGPVFYLKPGDSFTTAEAAQALLKTDLLAFCVEKGLSVPQHGANIDRIQQEGLEYTEGEDVFRLTDYGIFDLTMHYFIANMQWDIPFRVQCKSYYLRGPRWVQPGQTAKYTITDEDAAASRKYTFSVSGNEAVIDAAAGELEVSENAEVGKALFVSAAPEGDAAYMMEVRVVDGQLAALPEMGTEAENGFLVPVPSGNGWNTTVSQARDNGWIYRSYGTGEGGSTLIIEARTDSLGNTFREDDLAVQTYYDGIVFNSSAKNLRKENTRIDGHTARLFTYTTVDQGGQLYRVGEIVYARNNTTLTVNVYAALEGSDESALAPVSMSDLKKIAAQIHYDEEQASIRQADTKLTLTAEEDAELVSAGRTVRMIPTFANPESVSEAMQNAGIFWEILDAATGEPTDAAVMGKDGVITVRETLEEETVVEVKAVSEAFGTKASYLLTLIPASRKISIIPEQAYYLRGTEIPVVLKAEIFPETIPPKGLVWATSLPEVSEVLSEEDGTGLVRLTGDARELTVTVTDPNGKTAKAIIRAVDPVTGLEISSRGAARPGRTMTFRAVLEPKSGVDARVEWSLDVDEEIAVIGQDGVLTVSRNAQPGTEITVICKALGAAEPIVAEERLTVEE